jgi:diguanylate cyclase (GGDEF)-like protein
MRQALLAKITRIFLTILDWDLVKKFQAILWYASFTALTMYFIQTHYMYHPLANTELLVKLQWLFPSIIVVNTLIILFGFLLKNKPETHIYYVLFLSVFYPYSLLILPVGVGLLNLLNGIIFMGITFTTLLLFPRFVVYFGLVAYVIAYYLLAGLTILGYLDYAIAYKPYTVLHKDIQNTQIVYTMFYTTLYAAFTITLFDISVERWRKRSSRVERLSCTDELTGLLNRRGVNEMVSLQLQQAQITKKETSLIIVDIDDFKKINDQYGHQQGDLAIQHVANVLRDHLRSSDIVGRYGGEEFIIMLPFTSIENAQQIAKICLQALQRQGLAMVDEQTLSVWASFGVSSTASSGFDFAELFRQADRALYHAKSNGKNQVSTGIV